MRQLKIIKQITKRESSALERYLQEIALIPLLSTEEEVELAKKINQVDKKGNKTPVADQALKQLISANLRFVVSVSKQYQNQGLSLMDLIAIGNRGLIKAAKRYDHTRGFKFISFGVWWIRQGILHDLPSQSRAVRVPLNRVSILNKILKKRSELEQLYERSPTNNEIAEAIGTTAKEVHYTLQVSSKYMSTDSPFVKGEENTLLDVLQDKEEVSPDDNLMKESLVHELFHLMKQHIDARQRRIIISCFGIGGNPKETLDEIAKSESLTRERVRQIREQVIIILRTKTRNIDLEDYLK